MNIGALALIPSRRSAITWPISWTNSSTTKPTANAQPKNSAVGGDRDERRARRHEQLDLRQQQDHAFDHRARTSRSAADRREHAADPLAQRLDARTAFSAERVLAGGWRRNVHRRGLDRALGGTCARGRTERPSQAVSAARDRRCPCIHCGSTDKRCLTRLHGMLAWTGAPTGAVHDAGARCGRAARDARTIFSQCAGSIARRGLQSPEGAS